jgi:hypothetical protein
MQSTSIPQPPTTGKAKLLTTIITITTITTITTATQQLFNTLLTITATQLLTIITIITTTILCPLLGIQSKLDIYLILLDSCHRQPTMHLPLRGRFRIHVGCHPEAKHVIPHQELP